VASVEQYDRPGTAAARGGCGRGKHECVVAVTRLSRLVVLRVAVQLSEVDMPT
jgi:hypothetical protein